MEKQQAEAIAQAILEPDLKVQTELRRKREAENRSLALRRFIAAFVLVGFPIGAAVAYFAGERFTLGGLWGGIGGAAVGWAVAAWRERRAA
ncbi:hypothetical protein WCE34_14200 [Luteimonas sp. MJ204]|uniref:hypothetical protein n=1 Tax=Luteimonas sp. MJ145 TaxID=3129234 RepID=UPI0031BAE948